MNVPLTFKQFNILLGSIFAIGLAVFVLSLTVLSGTHVSEWLAWVGLVIMGASFAIPFCMGDVIELKQ